MKKLIITLFTLIPVLGMGQYVQVATHYDAEHTANHIMMGHVRMYLNDSVTEVVTEKKNNRWVTSYDSKAQVYKKVDKLLKKGKSNFTGSTNGGYRFYITVWDVKDDTKTLGSLDIVIDAYTQEIKSIDIKR